MSFITQITQNDYDENKNDENTQLYNISANYTELDNNEFSPVVAGKKKNRSSSSSKQKITTFNDLKDIVLKKEAANAKTAASAYLEIGGGGGKTPTTKTKKTKKQTEQKIMQEYHEDNDDKNLRERPDRNKTSSLVTPWHYLSQKEKNIFENKFTKPINKNQTEYFKLLLEKKKKIIFATGPAGTGKTLFAAEQGVRNFLLGNIEKLIFTRPSVSVDEDLGYLPGSLEEKMAPWIRPIYDILYQHISAKEVSALIEEKYIEISPLGFMRGRTFKNAWIVADEMQNSTISQMKMLLTRLGENSCLVITGDLQQYDKIHTDDANGLEDFLLRFKNKPSKNISSVEFNIHDIQREEVVKEVLEIYA